MNHNKLLTKQYLVGCYQKDDVNYHQIYKIPFLWYIRSNMRDLKRDVHRSKRKLLNDTTNRRVFVQLNDKLVLISIMELKSSPILTEHLPSISLDKKMRKNSIIYVAIWLSKVNEFHSVTILNVTYPWWQNHVDSMNSHFYNVTSGCGYADSFSDVSITSDDLLSCYVANIQLRRLSAKCWALTTKWASKQGYRHN